MGGEEIITRNTIATKKLGCCVWCFFRVINSIAQHNPFLEGLQVVVLAVGSHSTRTRASNPNPNQSNHTGNKLGFLRTWSSLGVG